MPDAPGVLDSGGAGGRVVRGGGLRSIAFVAAIAVSIGSTTLVTRHLHKVSYGRLMAVTSLLVIVAGITEGGLGNLGLREYTTAPEAERREFMANLLGLRIALSALGGMGAVGFAIVAGYTRVEIEGTAIASIGLVLANAQVTLAIPLVAELRLGWMAVIDFVGPFVNSLLFVVLVVFGARLLPFYAAGTIAFATVLAITSGLVRTQVRLRPAFTPSRWRSLVAQTLVIAAATTLTLVYFQVVLVAMSIIANGQQLGIFSLAFRVLTVVNGIPGVVMSSGLPILMRAAHDDHERLRYALQRAIEASLLLGGWLSLLVITVAPLAISVLGGTDFAGSTSTLQILGIGVAATFLSILFSLTMFALRRYRVLIVINGAIVLLSIGLCAALIPAHGAHGAAIVVVVVELSLAVANGATLFLTNPQLRPSLGLPARAVAAVGIAFAVALAVPTSSLVSAVIGSAVLAVAAVTLRAVPRDLIDAVRSRA
jgi:O-antigen/teichoic acid export membrane protein